MGRNWVVVWAALWAAGAGCGSAAQYCSFLEGHRAEQASMAADAAQKLSQMYPPEHNPVQLMHAVKDPFGQDLIQRLRRSGYSVLEAYTAQVGKHRRLGYVVDQVEGMNLLRLKLMVDDRTLSRAYVSDSEGLQAVGSWSSVRRDQGAQR